MNMMLSNADYEKCIEWILEKASAPVQYMTQLKVLGEKENAKKLMEAWQKVVEDPLSKYIFEKQQPDGSWFTGGPWYPPPSYVQKGGYTAVSPKYVTTVWILRILGDMGYTIKFPEVKKAVDYVFKWQLDNGVITEDRRLLGKPSEKNPVNVPCRMNIMMDGLSRVGASKDPRYESSIKRLIMWQREDGGWLSEGHKDGSNAPYKIWDRSCPWSSYFALSALYHSNLSKYKEELIHALNFQLWHLEQKNEIEIRKTFFHGHEPIDELKMLTDLHLGLESNQIKNLIQWLKEMYEPELNHFRFKNQKKFKPVKRADKVSKQVMKYRNFHLIEDDWLTYHILKIETNLRKH